MIVCFKRNGMTFAVSWQNVHLGETALHSDALEQHEGGEKRRVI
jgi:hypothetical protein